MHPINKPPWPPPPLRPLLLPHRPLRRLGSIDLHSICFHLTSISRRPWWKEHSYEDTYRQGSPSLQTMQINVQRYWCAVLSTHSYQNITLQFDRFEQSPKYKRINAIKVKTWNVTVRLWWKDKRQQQQISNCLDSSLWWMVLCCHEEIGWRREHNSIFNKL